MQTYLPVFTEDKGKEITAAPGKPYNFLLEGDNLHSLYLLEKTHQGKIDVIYIDPPYNTGNDDFIYDDNYIDKSDLFAHSKWLSFMNERLKLARALLSDDGFIMISIDDNEIAQLKLLCDEIFDENNLISIHHVQVRYAQKSLADGKPVKPVVEYILIYAKNSDKLVLNLPEEDYTDEKFAYEIRELSTGEIIKYNDGLELIVFKPGQWCIEKKEPSLKRLKETWISGTIYTKMSYGQVVRKYLEPRYNIDGTGCLYKVIGRGDDGLGYRYYVGPQKIGATRCKMYSGMPIDRVEDVKSGKAKRKVPLSNFYNYAADFGNIVNEGGIAFNSGKKPIKMLKNLISYFPRKNNVTILDFFAGSGSTAEAVMELNQEDEGSRRFILCTNNELTLKNQINYFIIKELVGKKPPKNTIAYTEWVNEWENFKMSKIYKTEVHSEGYLTLGTCRKITYPRIKTVITGIREDGSKYSDGIPANLKYYRTDFVSKDEEFLSDALLKHIAEMIQLEHGIKLDGKQYIMVMSDEEADKLAAHWDEYPEVKVLYVSKNVLLTTKQEQLFKNVEICIIPDYYFDFELQEVGESW